MSEERKRIPRECGNRTNNNFRCYKNESGVARTPAADGSNCTECPNYVYCEPRDAQKAAVAESDAKKGAAIGTVVTVVAAVLFAIGIFALTLLIKKCTG